MWLLLVAGLAAGALGATGLGTEAPARARPTSQGTSQGAGREPLACYRESSCEALCDTGNVSACLRLARILGEGLGVPIDHRGERRVLSRLCRQGQARGCVRMANLAADPREQRAWRRRAVDTARVSCRRGSAAECTTLGLLLLHDDPSTARRALVRACVAGSADGCKQCLRDMDADPSFSSWELYDFIAERQHILRDEGCKAGGANDCRELASWSGDRDLYERARRLYLMECYGGFGPSCAHAAQLSQRAGESATSVRLTKRACRMGVRPVCP